MNVDATLTRAGASYFLEDKGVKPEPMRNPRQLAPPAATQWHLGQREGRMGHAALTLTQNNRRNKRVRYHDPFTLDQAITRA
jgi:hypothetical protein